jgi:hypothetical protein
MKKIYFLIGTICLAALVSTGYLKLAPVDDVAQNSTASHPLIQLTNSSPPEKNPQAQDILTQKKSPHSSPTPDINSADNAKNIDAATPLISDISTPIHEQELTDVAEKLFTSVDKVFAVDINAAKLSRVKPDTVINLDLPQIGSVDYIIQDISFQNGITNLSGYINGDSNGIRSIHISWKGDAMFGSISTPHNVLHLATINNKNFLFIANPELTD